jgi:uncharacterized protein DUF4232
MNARRTTRPAPAAAHITAVLGLTGVLLGLAGCGGAAPTEQPPPTTAPPASAADTDSAAPATTPAGGAALPRCITGELAASLGDGDAAAGSVYRPLVFTNTGSRTCELRGFPGVSYVAGDDGHQVGPAAEMSGERGGQVPIPPGGTAQAQLQLVNVQNYDAAACSPAPVRGLRVYPPGDTASLFVPMDGTGCATPPPGPQLSIRTITP